MTVETTETTESTLVPHVLPLLYWPDNRLKTSTLPVVDFDKTLEQTVLDLITTMRYNNGIGLAAPQCAINQQIVVLELEENKPMIFINPVVTEIIGEDMFEWEEGCLSVPGYYAKNKRPNTIIVQYNDVGGDDKEVECRKLISFALQHEIDHLHGKTFVDDLSMFKRMRIKSKIKKTLNRK